MNDITNFEGFLLAGILLNLTPGNDTIFILTQSIGRGRQAGIVASLGIGLGSVAHTLLAALGLSVVIAQSLTLFNLIKYIGAIYLLFMGYQMIINAQLFGTNIADSSQNVNYRKIFIDAFFTNLLNPKVALFFMAFLPQFIDVAATNTVLPFLMLGITFITTGMIWCFVLTFCAAFIARKLKTKPIIATYINKICGIVLIGLGIKVALGTRN